MSTRPHSSSVCIDGAAGRTGGWLRTCAGLFKLRIGLSITLSALAGLAVASGGEVTGFQVTALALSVLLASAAAGGFNQYLERDLDARMRRTRNRPFVTGRLRAGPAWPALFSLMLAAAAAGAAWTLGPAVAGWLLAGAFTYVVVYTLWLKRRSVLNIVVGGLAGSFAVLAGAAAAGTGIGPGAWALAAVLFLWTPSHFWSLAIARHADYEAAGFPMLPVVAGDCQAARVILSNSLLLVAASLVPALLGMGWIYLAGAAGGGAYLLYTNLRLVRAPGPATGYPAFFASLAQLTLLLAGALLDAHLAL